jgi:hypothetical protein
MRNVKWLVAAALAVSTTGCVETYGYPTTSYGGYPSGYGYSSGNYAQPTYYRQPAYYQPAPRPYYHRDRDGDDDRHDWDRNGERH